MQADARFTASTGIRGMLPHSLRVALIAAVLSFPLLAGYPACAAHAAEKALIERLPQHWVDDQGRDVRLADYRGRRVFLTMAYATCRLICPMTMAHLKDLQRELDASGGSAEFVIVGYDPVSDDPPAWHQYRRSRGLLRDNWHFLTGTVTSTAQLARQLGFPFWKYDRHVMHEARIVMLDERGELATEYTPKSARSAGALSPRGSDAEQN